MVPAEVGDIFLCAGVRLKIALSVTLRKGGILIAVDKVGRYCALRGILDRVEVVEVHANAVLTGHGGQFVGHWRRHELGILFELKDNLRPHDLFHCLTLQAGTHFFDHRVCYLFEITERAVEDEASDGNG